MLPSVFIKGLNFFKQDFPLVIKSLSTPKTHQGGRRGSCRNIRQTWHAKKHPLGLLEICTDELGTGGNGMLSPTPGRWIGGQCIRDWTEWSGFGKCVWGDPQQA